MEAIINQTFSLILEDTSQTAEARRIAQRLCKECNFSEEDFGKFSIIVTELSTNILKHASSGELLIQKRRNSDGTLMLEAFAIDSGKGISNIDQALEDGYSTAGSPGTGLGAIRRQATTFDIYSIPQKGTVVAVSYTPDKPKKTIVTSPIEISGINVPLKNQSVSGDAWDVKVDRDSVWIGVIDGIGHGTDAHAASTSGIATFWESNGTSTDVVLEDIHYKLRSSRGAAGSIARINLAQKTVHFSGIGNVNGVIIAEVHKRLLTHNGTLGHAVRKVQEVSYPFETGSLIALYSDGLVSQWSIDAYPGLKQHSVAAIAAVVYRDFSRRRDDASIVIGRVS